MHLASRCAAARFKPPRPAGCDRVCRELVLQVLCREIGQEGWRWGASGSCGNAQVPVCPGCDWSASGTQIRALTREELAEWWKLYVAAVDKQLNMMDTVAHDAAPLPDSATQLAALQREALLLLTRCRTAARPSAMCGF